MKKPSFGFIVTVSLVLVTFSVITYRQKMNDRIHSSICTCYGNMMAISSAKAQWEMAYHITTNRPVDLPEFLEYFKGSALPLCPLHGTYTIGNVWDEPSCSIHGDYEHAHDDSPENLERIRQRFNAHSCDDLPLALNVHADEQTVPSHGGTVTNAQLVVHPGIGIPGIMARGMSIADMRQATGDTKMYTNSVGRVFFPSIGAFYDLSGMIFFISSHSDYPDLHFTGSILGGPSFATGPVHRTQIIASFGEPMTHVVCESPNGPGDSVNFKRYINTEIDFSEQYRIGKGPLDREIIYYQGKGLWFWLKNDVVECLCVCKSWTRKARSMDLPYNDFGPQVLAYPVLGMAWYQWNEHGPSRVSETDDVRVVIYANQSLDAIQAEFPVIKFKQDYRYITYDDATTYLERSIKEHGDSVAQLKVTLECLRAFFER